MEIIVSVRNRHAQPVPHPQFLVCGNQGYLLRFDFDAEWDAFPQKMARVVIYRGSGTESADIPLSGGSCRLPAVFGTDQIEVGVYAGEICTTTPARIQCLPCITDFPAAEFRPEPDVLRTVMARLAGQPADPPCFGKYLVTKNGDYIVTDQGDYLLTKE